MVARVSSLSGSIAAAGPGAVLAVGPHAIARGRQWSGMEDHATCRRRRSEWGFQPHAGVGARFFRDAALWSMAGSVAADWRPRSDLGCEDSSVIPSSARLSKAYRGHPDCWSVAGARAVVQLFSELQRHPRCLLRRGDRARIG